MTAYKDRRVGLIIFGVVQLLIGGMAALAVPFLMFSVVAASRLSPEQGGAGQMPLSMMVASSAIYVLMAILFIALGVGSLLARRWARALTLVVSWWWLVMGAVSVVAMAVVMPMIFSTMRGSAGSGSMPGMVETITILVMVGFMSFFYVIIPGVFVLFYRSPHVRATCEAADPKPRWTDACPLPVLGAALLFALSALFMPLMGAYRWTIPFFGQFLQGTAGAAVSLGTACACFLVAIAAYRLKQVGWWGMVALVLSWSVSTCLTFQNQSLVDLYRTMGMPVESLELFEGMTQFSTLMVAMTVVGAMASVGYLFFIRRFFVHAPALGDAK